MKRIKEFIKEEINIFLESWGKQDDISNHSKELAELIVSFLGNYIKINKEDLYDGYEWEFSRKEIIKTDYFKKSTLIGGIKLSVNYLNSKENKISGFFKRVQLLDNGYYLVFLEINVKIKDNIENYINQIEYWISHELHHAFRYIKTINKKSKSNSLNWVKNKTRNLAADFLHKHPSLNEFVDMIYLSLPQEVEARKQETASQLKYDKSINPDQTYEYLMQFQPITDSRKMRNYSTEEVLKIDINTLKQFMDIFNKNLKEKGLDTWIRKDINIFFEFWKERIVDAGVELKKNINRMVSDKYLYKNESELYDNVDWDIISEAYGIKD